MHSKENRAFGYAMAASIVLHGVLLFGISQRDRARRAAPQMPSILARLVESPAPAPAAEPPPRSAPAKPPPQIKPTTPKRLARPAPAPTPTPQAAVAPAVEQAPVAETPADATSSEASVAQVLGKAEDASAAAAAALPAPPAAASAEDPGSLDKYRLLLNMVARNKYRRYPRNANSNDWTGSVYLRMVVGPSGDVTSLTVTKTSGHEVLDRQAQEMFRNAAAEVPVPPVLRGKQFAVELLATYYLTD
jgi:protein TonB